MERKKNDSVTVTKALGLLDRIGDDINQISVSLLKGTLRRDTATDFTLIHLRKSRD